MRALRPLLLCTALLLGGCFSSVQMAPELEATAAEAGLVFGTLGISAAAPTIEMSGLNFRRAGEAKQRGGMLLFFKPVGFMGGVLSPMYDTPIDFDEEGSKGTLFVAVLPAGDYEVTGAFVENAPFSGWGSHMYEPDAGRVPFHVAAGKATYLGQFLSHLRIGRDAHRVPKVQGAYLVVSDRLERDLGLLARKRAAPAAADVINLAPRFMQVNNEALRAAPE